MMSPVSIFRSLGGALLAIHGASRYCDSKCASRHLLQPHGFLIPNWFLRLADLSDQLAGKDWLQWKSVRGNVGNQVSSIFRIIFSCNTVLSSVQAESAAARTACGGKILGAPHFPSPFLYL